MKLTYLYHSGFALDTDGALLIFDYFKAPDGIFPLLDTSSNKAIYVFSSHRHPDHYNPEIQTWSEHFSQIRYLFSADIVKRKKPQANGIISLHRGESFSDEILSVNAYGSTDIGVSFLIRIEGKTIFHAGDLNNWHWKMESTPQEMKKADGDFLAIVRDIEKDCPQLFLAMFPIDPRLGDEFGRGAEQFIKRIPCTYFAPMHMWDEYERVNATFMPVAQRVGTHYLPITHAGQSFLL